MIWILLCRFLLRPAGADMSSTDIVCVLRLMLVVEIDLFCIDVVLVLVSYFHQVGVCFKCKVVNPPDVFISFKLLG